jgi:chromosome segregation ATPase
VAERALKLFIAEVTEPGRRAAALHAMEEALLGRMDRRLGQHYERVAGLYAREAFDVAQTLDLVKKVLWYSVRADKETYGKYVEDSRKEASRVLKVRAEIPLPGSNAEEAVKKAQAEVARLQDQIEHLNQVIKKQEQMSDVLHSRARKAEERAADLEQDWHHEHVKAEKTEARFTWAIQQFELQRGLGRRPIAEFLRLWDQQHGDI